MPGALPYSAESSWSLQGRGDAKLIESIQNRLTKALESQGSSKAVRAQSGAALGSSIGLLRQRNEDCCLVARASYANGGRTNFTIAMVCDGLGGMSQGREAAILAAAAFTAHLFCSPNIAWKDRLSQAVSYVNAEVHRRLRGDGGTTLSAVISSRSGAMFCHVGDSRIYGVTAERNLEQLSRDDTINALLKREDGELDARKNSRLLQFVGMGEEMEAQIAEVPFRCRSVILTSDGAHDVPHSLFQRIVSAAAGGSDLVRKLLALSEMTGGRDNASAILLPIGSDAELNDDVGEDELLAILPNDTLAIHLAGLGTWGRSGQMRGPSLDPHPSAPGKQNEEAKAAVNSTVRDAKPKPDASAAKVRATKPRKPKKRPTKVSDSDVPDRLPFDEPENQVDVQFSPAAHKRDEDKE